MRVKLGKYTLHNSQNMIKSLAVTLSKQVKDLYDKNFKSLKKKSKISEDRKISHAPGLAGLI